MHTIYTPFLCQHSASYFHCSISGCGRALTRKLSLWREPSPNRQQDDLPTSMKKQLLATVNVCPDIDIDAKRLSNSNKGHVCQELLKAVQLPLLKQHAQGCFYLEDHLSLGQVAPEGSPAPHITGHRPSKNYLRWSRPPGSDFPVSDSDSLEA